MIKLWYDKNKTVREWKGPESEAVLYRRWTTSMTMTTLSETSRKSNSERSVALCRPQRIVYLSIKTSLHKRHQQWRKAFYMKNATVLLRTFNKATIPLSLLNASRNPLFIESTLRQQKHRQPLRGEFVHLNQSTQPLNLYHLIRCFYLFRFISLVQISVIPQNSQALQYQWRSVSGRLTGPFLLCLFHLLTYFTRR